MGTISMGYPFRDHRTLEEVTEAERLRRNLASLTPRQLRRFQHLERRRRRAGIRPDGMPVTLAYFRKAER